MPTLKHLSSQIDFTNQVHGFVRTSQEIAIMRMQASRDSVLGSRTYVDGILSVFRELKQSDAARIDALIKKSKGQRFESKNSKRVNILLTATNRFSGNISTAVFSQFVEKVSQEQGDIIVIGSVGKDLFDLHFKNARPYTFVDLELGKPDPETIATLLHTLLEYDTIEVTYGRFITLVDQVPTHTLITGNDTLLQEETTPTEETKSEAKSYAFEPGLETLLAFFETQIAASLFRATLQESELSILGSRIQTLEGSIAAVEKNMELLHQKRSRFMHAAAQKKQLQRIAGRRLWAS